MLGPDGSVNISDYMSAIQCGFLHRVDSVHPPFLTDRYDRSFAYQVLSEDGSKLGCGEVRQEFFGASEGMSM